MKLYEINQEIEACMKVQLQAGEKVVNTETGEVFDADYLDKLAMERADKLENVGLWIKNLQAESTAYAEEIQQFAIRKQRADKKIDSLKNYLTLNLQGEKFETDRLLVNFRKSESVVITNETLIPAKYIKVKTVTTTDPDKRAIKAAIKGGEVIAGAKISVNQNISIA